VFFTRPTDDVLLTPLVEESPMIAEAAAKAGEKYKTSSTAGEWFSRRIKNQRIKNRTVRMRTGIYLTTV